MRDEVQLRHEEKAWDINMMQSDEQKPSEDTTSVEGEAKRKNAWWQLRWKKVLVVLVLVLLLLMLSLFVFQGKINYLRGIPITTKTVMLPGDIPIEMVWIPESPSKMKNNDEDLQYPERICQGIWMGKTECTQKQWRAVMKTLHYAESNGQRRITQVSWDETQAFIRRLNELTGKVFRLPTAAEWQYACRAGTETSHVFLSRWESPSYTGCVVYHGDDSLNAPFSTANGIGGTNGWGLHCMKDNIDEWCQDGCYDAKDFYAPRFIDPIETKELPFRAIRNYGATNEVHSTSFRLVLPEIK